DPRGPRPRRPLRRRRGARRRVLRRPRRHDHERHRAERRRQDDGLQRDHGLPAPHARADRVRRRPADGAQALGHRGARDRPYVPAHERVPLAQRRRQRHDRPPPPGVGGRSRRASRAAPTRRRGVAAHSRRRRHPRVPAPLPSRPTPTSSAPTCGPPVTTTDGTPLLSLEDLHAAYGPVAALRGLDLVVHPGELVCLLGANGAGKTSTLRAVSGLLSPTRGRIVFDGRPIHGADPRDILAAGLAPTLVKATFEIIADIRRRGTTVLMVEQNAYLALRMADRGYVMETGRVVLGGPAAELLGNDLVRRAYLGG